MISPSFPYLAAAAALALVAAPAPLRAQAVVQPLPGSTPADRLADYMRRLAANPQDGATLIDAGELSLKLDDLSAAAALFARAEKVDPRNARVKAGMASILVRSERPGEALRYFAQAETMGLDPARFAADRGLAYDLIGEQERAQRDYRLALRDGADDETTRRYALSLGISGRRDQALAELDPLLRETDRGAWRARAFILAMAGDQPGAERIATTMMPPGMAAGLQSFFERLATLGPADRAFAVHFGEVHASAERLADARLAPALPALTPEAGTITQIAAVQPTPVPAKADRRRRGKAKPGRTEMAVAAAPVAQPLPTPPAYQGQPVVLAAVQPLRTVRPRTAAEANAASAAQLGTTAAPSRSVAPIPASPRPPARTTAPVTLASTSTTAPTPRPGFSTATASPAQPTSAAVVAVPAPQPKPVEVASTSAAAAPAPPAVAIAGPPLPAPTPPPRSMAAHAGEDSILARIIAGLSIPASELEVAKPARVKPASANVVAVAREKEARDTAAQQVVAQQVVAQQVAAETRRTRGRTAPVADDALPAKKPLDRKALAAKKAADDKKLADARAAAEEKKAARANPGRIWVQVAGGAYEGDLPKAWKAAQAKAPALAGRAGYTTPLRATNRVVTGPFKTAAEARTFVNQLAKQGMSAFTFTSDAGQKVTRLPVK